MKKLQIHIASSTLEYSKCLDFIKSPAYGAIGIFDGIVRNKNLGEDVSHLHFECYEKMATTELIKIAEEAFAKFDVGKIYIAHRMGNVKISESAVLIGSGSVHRKAALHATEYIIDELKKRVPIWKKEFATSGAFWVNSRP